MRYMAIGTYVWDSVNGCVYAQASGEVVAENTARQLNVMVEVRNMVEDGPRLYGAVTGGVRYVGFRSQNMMYSGSGI